MTATIRSSFAVFGAAGSLTDAQRRTLFDRSTSLDDDVRRRTANIIARVRREGDAALREMAATYDGATLDALEVSRAVRRRALDAIDANLRRAMERAARNIAAVHAAEGPLRGFMAAHTREEDIALMTRAAGRANPDSIKAVPMLTLIPAFMISELRAAFIIGFVIFVPFLVIDMVVSAALMSMGMMMLPPVMISLPF